MRRRRILHIHIISDDSTSNLPLTKRSMSIRHSMKQIETYHKTCTNSVFMKLRKSLAVLSKMNDVTRSIDKCRVVQIKSIEPTLLYRIFLNCCELRPPLNSMLLFRECEMVKVGPFGPPRTPGQGPSVHRAPKCGLSLVVGVIVIASGRQNGDISH